LPNPAERKMAEAYQSEFTGLNPMHTTMQMFSPNRLLVESATMIFIIAFGLFLGLTLIWKGSTLESTTLAFVMMGVFLTFFIAVRQYASFR
tara:strand:- start:175 stop:447 length:273 start_codon:yes stop_codon:yes gene_type:complete